METSERTAKAWHLLPHDQQRIEQLARKLRVAPILAQTLLNRGLEAEESARGFLDAPLSGLRAPQLLPGIPEAVERLHAAVGKRRRVCIYGDYDVDGTTGTAILWQLLHLLGTPAEFYVPHRLDEGYGLNCEALRQLAAGGVQTVVTVDCGIASLEEAHEARRLGLELIVTDHHEMKSQLPDAAAIVHPRLPGTNYPFSGLSGAAVAFKLAWALCQRHCGSDKVTPRFKEFLLESVGLAALGIIADVVPLHDENRVFVRHGLSRLKTAPSPGLKALLEAAKLHDRTTLLAEDVSFKLAPRLNAAGRLGSARLVIELLTTQSADRAVKLAQFLEGQNSQRQQVERRIVSEANEMIAAHGHDKLPALVLAHPDWHPGIIGIVASRLVEQYGRPVLLVALRGGQNSEVTGHGSGRSIPGFALHEALADCGQHLLSHGGHASAVGFRVAPERIDALRDAFCQEVERAVSEGLPRPRLVLDAEVPLATITSGLLRALDQLEPYGMGNRRPVFLATGLRIPEAPRKVGGGERHLSFRVTQRGAGQRAIAFDMAERLDELMSKGGDCCLAFSPKINVWQGFQRVDLHVVDFQSGSTAILQQAGGATF